MATASGLEHIPDVSRLSDSITRILGQNPGKFTLQGTNTYLVDLPPHLILIDTGDFDKPEYTSQLRKVLLGTESKDGPSQPGQVTDIILTHWHHDHVGGLVPVLELISELRSSSTGSGRAGSSSAPPKIHKFPSPENDPEIISTLQPSLSESLFTPPSPSAGTELGDRNPMIHGLSKGQELADGRLQVFHTPGHTADSIMLLLLPDGRSDVGESKSLELFTADTVLGQGTAVFEDLSLYMTSLSQTISHLTSTYPDKRVRLYPGHGPIIEDGIAKMREYVAHRLEREKQVVKALEAFEGKGASVESLVEKIYSDTIPRSLYPAAAHGLNLHLRKLEDEGRARVIDESEGRGQGRGVDGEGDGDGGGEERWTLGGGSVGRGKM